MKTTNITEARRYIANAKKILADNTTNDGYLYDDPKYVKIAGHAAYAGVLMALSPLVQNKKTTINIKDYQQALGKRNYKAVDYLINLYQILHLACGYEGTTGIDIFKSGIKHANMMIDWAEQNLPIIEVRGKTDKLLASIPKKPVKKKK